MEDQILQSPPEIAKIDEDDKSVLQTAKTNKTIALLNAEKAISQHQTAEINYKYVILQLYMKYGLTQEDSIDEQGNIQRGGASV